MFTLLLKIFFYIPIFHAMLNSLQDFLLRYFNVDMVVIFQFQMTTSKFTDAPEVRMRNQCPRA